MYERCSPLYCRHEDRLVLVVRRLMEDGDKAHPVMWVTPERVAGGGSPTARDRPPVAFTARAFRVLPPGRHQRRDV